MMKLAKADFYYGALLSQLVNSGFAPAIIEQGEARRVYEISNNYSDYILYCKYLKKPKATEKGSVRWNFVFSVDEVQRVLRDTTITIYAFICGKDGLRNSEITFLTRDELMCCIGEHFASPERRVSVLLEKGGSRNFTVYGTALEVKETPLKVTRNMEARLHEFVLSMV